MESPEKGFSLFLKMTERLYWKEPYSKKFKGKVFKKEISGDKIRLILDRTLFYPNSGGQLCDLGIINGAKVIDVIEEGEEIIHIIERDIEGEEITGEVNWERRFDNMQQHTGQHILSQAFLKILRAETLSSNLGEDVSVIELNLSKIEWEDVEKVEDFANKIVHENREIYSHILKSEEWKKFPLRKPPPDEKEIRIVEIKDFDFSACGGTHLSRTGEVGLIKIIGWERIRGNIRVEFICGRRATRDYQKKHKILKNLSLSLTVGIEELGDSVFKIRDELIAERKRSSKLEEKIMDFEIKELLNSQEGFLVEKIFDGIDLKNLRKFTSKIISLRECVAIIGGKGERGDLIIACSESIPLDLRGILGLVEEKLEGKGGGTKNFIQINGERGLLEETIKVVRKEIEKILNIDH